MVLYLAACSIELIDQAELIEEPSAISIAADTMRATRSGDDPLGFIHGVQGVTDGLGHLGSAFDTVAAALR